MADFKVTALHATGINRETTPSQRVTVKRKFPPLRSGLVRKPKNIADEPLPMVIIAPSETECLSKYAIPLESVSNEGDADSSMKIIEILNNVNQGVRELEEMYDSTDEKNAMDGDFLSSFLSFCNRHSSELSSSIQEEHEILASLLSWFENELLQLQESDDEDEEESSKTDQLPEAGSVEAEVLKMRQGIMKLTKLKDRIKELPKLSQPSIPSTKGEKKRKGTHTSVHQIIKAPSDDAVLSRDSQEMQAILRSLQSESKLQNVEMKQKIMQEIAKLFQKQTTRIQKLEKDHGDVQSKYNKIKTDCQVLSEANNIMEKELKKLKGQRNLRPEELSGEEVMKEGKKKPPTKKGAKEKKGVRPDSAVSDEHIEEGQQKMLEELVAAQRKTNDLQLEKKDLENKLQNALKEAAKAKEELKLFKSTTKSQVAEAVKPVSVDTPVSTKLRRASIKSGTTTDSTPILEQQTLKKGTSEELLKPASANRSRVESKGRKLSMKASEHKGAGKVAKKSGSRTSDLSQQDIDVEKEAMEQQKGKEALSAVKKASQRQIQADHRASHGGKRQSVHLKAARKASPSQEAIRKSEEAQRTDKGKDIQETVTEAEGGGYTGKEMVALDSTEKQIYGMAELSPSQQILKGAPSQMHEDGEAFPPYETSETQDFPSRVSRMGYETGSTVELPIGQKVELHAVGFKKKLSLPATPELSSAGPRKSQLFKPAEAADQEGLLILDHQQAPKMQQAVQWRTDLLRCPFHRQTQDDLEAVEWGIDQEGRPIQSREAARMMQHVSKRAADQSQHPVQFQTQLGAAQWGTDQYGHPVQGREQAQMMWGAPGQVTDWRALTTEQKQKMWRVPVTEQGAFLTEQQQKEAAQWGIDQMGRPIQDRQQAPMEAAQWGIDQMGRPIQDRQQALMEATQWGVDQMGRPIQDHQQALMFAPYLKTDPFGRPIKPDQQADVMYAPPGWDIGPQSQTQAQVILGSAGLYKDQTKLPFHSLGRDHMMGGTSRYHPTGLFRQIGGPYLADSLFSKEMSSKLRYDQLLITGIGLQRLRDKQGGPVETQPKPKKWFLPYSVQMLHLFFPFYEEENLRMNQVYGRSVFKNYRSTSLHHQPSDTKRRFRGQEKANVPYTATAHIPKLFPIGPEIKPLPLISRAHAAAEKGIDPFQRTMRSPGLPKHLPQFYRTSAAKYLIMSSK